MRVTTFKTPPILSSTCSIQSIIDQFVPEFEEKDILVITSKIVSLCEGRSVPVNQANKDDLIAQESEWRLPRSLNPYNVALSIANEVLAPSAGIDESNANNEYVLWPADPQQSARSILQFLKQKFHLTQAGVIISDSKTTPLRWGTTGFALSHAGFKALKNYIGTPDLFGRTLTMTKANVMDGLAASAVVVMGEGNESTPLARIQDVSFVEFSADSPTAQEQKDLHISLEEDLYALLLKNAPWEKGKKNS